MSDYALTNQIPATNPRRRDVEEAIRNALRTQPPQPWTVEITVSGTSTARWFIKLSNGATGLRHTVFVNGRTQQNPRIIHDRILEALA